MKYNFEFDLNQQVNTSDLANFLKHVLSANGAEVNAIKFKPVSEYSSSEIQDVKDIFE